MPAPDRSLPASLLEDWVHYIESTMDAPEGPSVQTLLSIAEDHGEGPGEDLLPALAHRCGTRAVQQAWAEWTAVTDREELRLRLEVMASLADLDDSLTGCILFFFRSSDPLLYQAAARALGTHLDAHPALDEYLQHFAERHSVDLHEPVPLNGERSRRRILIAMAAHRAAGHSEVPVLSTREPEKLLAASSLDLTVGLTAVRLILDGAPASDDWTSFAFALLEGLTEHPAATSGDPQLLRSWGLLLSTLGARAPSRSTEAWWALLRRLVSPPGRSSEPAFATRLQQLHRLDELVRAAARLPVFLQSSLLEHLPALNDDRLQRFLRYRWYLWATGTDAPSRSAGTDLLPSSVDDGEIVLSSLIEAERGASDTPSPLGNGSVKARRHSTFVTLLKTMGERPDWLHRPVEQRALIAFAALDFSRHLSLPSAAVDATFDRFGFPDLRDDSTTQNAGAGAGRAGPATFRILLRLSDWEATGTERLIGTSLLHQITDSYVLMMLLPSRRASELTASLADAIEHQLRLHLRTKPDFRPEQFLYETTVRAPHPQFYEHLHRLCRDRTYQNAQGQELPVAEIIDHIRVEIGSVHASSPPSEEADQTPWPGDPAISKQLQYVRRTLTAIRTEPDLIDGLEQMVDVLDPKTKDPATGSKRLFGILTAPGATTAPLVHRTAAWDDPPTYRALRTELQEHVIGLRNAIDHLQPDSLEGADDVRDDALEIEDVLTLVESHVVPVLGVVEGTLLGRTLQHLRSQLQAWIDALATLHTHWRLLRDTKQDDAESADRLFDHVLDRETGPIRMHLVSLLAHTLAPAASLQPSDGRHRKTWAETYTVLEWAIAPAQLEQLSGPESETWMEVFTAQWQSLLAQAMDAGYEARVRHLTTDPSFERVWRQPAAAESLDDARTWFLDRYHLPAARQLTTALHSHTPLGGIASTTTAFLAHFSRVWLALLLGAVLMLDFGGAWTAMAAEGDVVSVGVTFVVGLLGTLGYLFIDLRQKVHRPPGESVWRARRSRWLRLITFLGVCLLVTVGLTSTLWFLLSGTGEVVEGPGAVLHVVVWTGFALFVGIFFGLLAESA